MTPVAESETARLWIATGGAAHMQARGRGGPGQQFCINATRPGPGSFITTFWSLFNFPEQNLPARASHSHPRHGPGLPDCSSDGCQVLLEIIFHVMGKVLCRIILVYYKLYGPTVILQGVSLNCSFITIIGAVRTNNGCRPKTAACGQMSYGQ